VFTRRDLHRLDSARLPGRTRTAPRKGGARYTWLAPPYSAYFYSFLEYARTRFERVPKSAENNNAGSIGNINVFNVIGRPGIKNNIGKYAIKKKTI